MRSFKGFLALLLLSAGLLVSPARAQTLLGVFDQPFAAAAPVGGCTAGATVCLIFQQYADNGTDQSTPYTFSSVPFGTASSDRMIVVALTGGSASGTAAISSVDIGGVSATRATTSASGGLITEFWYAAVPSGTTGSIVVTGNGQTFQRMATNTWSITATTQTAYADRASATLVCNFAAGACSQASWLGGTGVPAGGVTMMIARYANGAVVGAGATMSGGATVNPRANTQVNFEGQWNFSADAANSGTQFWLYAQTSPTVNNIQMNAITWGP